MDQRAQLRPDTLCTSQQAKPRVYSDEEWKAQKSNFARLYEDNTLSKVIIAMQRDHGFVATKRQYKRKIAKWGLQKNIKGNEMLAIAIQKVKRKVETGKDSKFSIRDRPVREDKIKRYMKRQNIDESDFILHGMPVADPKIAIMCDTPPNASSGCTQLDSIQAFIQFGSDDEDSVPRSISHMTDDHYMTDQHNSFVTCEDGAQLVFSPTPSRSKAQSRIGDLLLHDLTDPISTPPQGNEGSRKRESISSPSPSINDTASEILVAFSPLLLPSMVSLTPPSAVLRDTISPQPITIYGNIFNRFSIDRHHEALELEYKYGYRRSIDLKIEHTSASKLLWHVADAGRALLSSITGNHLRVLDKIRQFYRTEHHYSIAGKEFGKSFNRFLSSPPSSLLAHRSILLWCRNMLNSLGQIVIIWCMLGLLGYLCGAQHTVILDSTQDSTS